jgi:hypothetical protein
LNRPPSQWACTGQQPIPTFTALGALNQNIFGFNSEIPFDVETLTLAQALGKAGGLNDQLSDPREVYVNHFENRHFLRKFGVDTRRFTTDRIPTIYRPNVRDPSGILLATGFQMRSKDVMYVANARVVDYYKLLTLINDTAASLSNTANAVTNVNIAAKDRAVGFKLNVTWRRAEPRLCPLDTNLLHVQTRLARRSRPDEYHRFAGPCL